MMNLVVLKVKQAKLDPENFGELHGPGRSHGVENLRPCLLFHRHGRPQSPYHGLPYQIWLFWVSVGVNTCKIPTKIGALEQLSLGCGAWAVPYKRNPH